MSINHISLEIIINPSVSSISACGKITFRNIQTEVSGILLNPDLTWHKLAIISNEKEFSVDAFEEKLDDDSFLKVAKNWKIILPNAVKNEENITLYFEYSGKIMQTSFDINYIRENVVELADYAAWYPLIWGEIFSFDLTLHSPENWVWMSNGNLLSCRECFKWRSSTKQNSIALFGFPKENAIPEEKEMRIWGSVTNYHKFISLEKNFKKMERRLKEWLDPTNQGDFKIILVPRSKGGSYVRGNMMIYPEDLPDNYFTELWRNVVTAWTHELSHIWFNKTNPDEWHNWIDESLADYCAFIVAKEEYGEEFFNQLIKKRTELIKKEKDLPSIKETKRDHKQAYTLYYYWGTLIHNNVSKEIGLEKMKDVIKDLAKKSKIKDKIETLDYIESLNKITGKDWTDYIDKMVSETPEV